MEAFLEEFKQECNDLFQQLERCLLDIEKTYDEELLDEIYRHLHTLKGGAGMFGFSQMELLAHELESCFSNIKDNKLKMSQHLTELSLEAIDLFKSILAGNSLVSEVENAISLVRQTSEGSTSGQPTANETSGSTDCYAILLKPEKNIFKRGINFEAVLEELRGLGFCTMFAHNAEISLEEQFSRKEVLSSFEIFFQSNITPDELGDVLLFMKESEKKVIPLVSDNFYNDDYAAWFTLDEPAIDQRRSTIKNMFQSVTGVNSSQRKSTKLSSGIELTPNPKSTYINVATSKLDHLINVVSELVIFRSELQHLLEEKEDPALTESIEKLDRLTLTLRDSAFSIRLVPLNIVSVKLQRLVRTLCDELGKEVDFMMDGLHTELDRSMINALEAPLMHLIRNAIDHGIESPAERRASNKPTRGLLKLYSYNSGDHVFIQLQDDGRGINFKKIRKRAVETGIISEGQQLSEKELLNVMLMPGFSTADKITSVSGRGVGMDVVKKEIAALRGDVEISTEQALGSIFTIRLPLTLTVLDTLIVKVDSSNYLLPVSEIEHCYKVSGDQLFHKPIRQINYRGELIPFISLREQFNHDNPPMEHTMVVINKNDRKLGVVVDAIAGSLQTVYKPLNNLLQPLDCFSGTSILGDGTMAFIINPLKLSC
jgi:two-component system, chemotaxis family, sensor kinase CheA